MYVVFKSNKKGLGKILSAKKKFSLVEADEKLKEFARTLPVTKTPNLIMIEIYDGKEAIFRSEFVAGTDDSSNFLLLLMYLLKTEFPEIDEDEKSELLQRINHAYINETNPKEPEKEKVRDTIPLNVSEERDSSLEDPPIATSEITKQKTHEKNMAKEKKTKKIRKLTSQFVGFFNRSKKMIILAVLLLIIFGAGVFLSGAIGANQKDTYSELVKKGQYSQALQEYPKKEFTLIEKLYSEKDSKDLKKLASRQHSKLALFYWSFLNQKWKQVTDIRGISQDTTIQAMRGYAYLAQGKMEEAELINKVLKNDTLQNQIIQAKKNIAYEKLRDQDIASAEVINKEIKDSQLEDDVKVAKSIVNLLKKYKADKENPKLAESERKEAKNNYDSWTENLKQLGGTKNDGK